MSHMSQSESVQMPSAPPQRKSIATLECSERTEAEAGAVSPIRVRIRPGTDDVVRHSLLLNLFVNVDQVSEWATLARFLPFVRSIMLEISLLLDPLPSLFVSMFFL